MGLSDEVDEISIEPKSMDWNPVPPWKSRSSKIISREADGLGGR